MGRRVHAGKPSKAHTRAETNLQAAHLRKMLHGNAIPKQAQTSRNYIRKPPNACACAALVDAMSNTSACLIDHRTMVIADCALVPP